MCDHLFRKKIKQTFISGWIKNKNKKFFYKRPVSLLKIRTIGLSKQICNLYLKESTFRKVSYRQVDTFGLM